MKRLPRGYVQNIVAGASPSGKGIAVMLRAYFDDSGTHDGSAVCSVGGYVAEPEQWDNCQPKWDEVLAEFNRVNGSNVRYFHMADCVGGYEDFRGMSCEVRASLMVSLLDLAKAYSIRGIGSVLPMRDYLDVIGDPDKRSHGTPAPFTLCAEGSFCMTKGWALASNRKEPLAFFIENGTKHRGEILEGFDRARKYRQMGGLWSLDSLTQAPKQMVGIQMADVYAWTLGAEANGRLQGLPAPFMPLVSFLNEDHPHEHWPWDREKLEAGKRTAAQE